ncbi:MAG TPA: signal peptidase I [Acidimicrobiales bacterium]|nr:signal peptidase I [Acidimicrobiales bacterium]
MPAPSSASRTGDEHEASLGSDPWSAVTRIWRGGLDRVPGGGRPPARSRRRRWIEDGAIVALAVVIAVLVRALVAQAYWIPSASMEPQLRIDDRVVVSRLAYHLHPVRRGDIVVFKSPPGVEPPPSVPSNPVARVFRDAGVALGFAQDETVLIKRVIGLPGDRISGANGHVYIDGELLLEPYLPAGAATSTFGPVMVPAGHVWVMGDNRGNSLDSRIFGPIPTRAVIGRAIWKVWPPWSSSFL